MSRKQFNSRLEGLFSDPEPSFPSWQADDDQSLPGWTWECDYQGKIIACSPEIEEVLGFRPDDLVGQPLTSFGLAPESASTLQSALNSGEFPINLDVQYMTVDGATIQVSMHIFEISTGGKKKWGGFAQALFVPKSNRLPGQGDQTIISHLTKSAPWNESRLPPFKIGRDLKTFIEEGEKQNGKDKVAPEDGVKELPDKPHLSNHILASEKVKEILETIRQNSSEITEFEFSQIITSHKEELKEDRSKRPIVTGSLAGIEIRSYPKKIVQEIEHRLEWGNKLDLTAEEKVYLESHKYNPSGLSGYMKRRSAPKEIIKQDKLWIAVSILVEKGKSKRIQVNFDKEQYGNDSINLDEFLQNPKILFPNLKKALKAPWHSQVTLRIGEDYLITR